MAIDDRDQFVGVPLVRPLERVDVGLVVVADEIAYRLAVTVRPGIEVRADHVFMSATVMPSEATQERSGQGTGGDCQRQTPHWSRRTRSGGKKISFWPSKHASR